MSSLNTLIQGDTIIFTNEFKRAAQPPKKAELITAFTGNKDLKFTAVEDGETGNGISIEYKDTGAYGTVGAVEVKGKAITVTLGRPASTNARYTTDFNTGANNNFVATAIPPGDEGNNLSIELVHPNIVSASIAVFVLNNKRVIVSLATDANGTITSTAALVRTAIMSDATARNLMTIDYADGSTGAGVVPTLARSFLTGATTAGETATLTTNVGANANITYTAKTEGVDGNSISLTYLGGVSQSLAVAIIGSDITVQLATDGAGTVTTTANALISYFQGAGTNCNKVRAMLQFALKTGENGSAILAAMPKTNLAGGTDITSTAGEVKALLDAAALATALIKIEFADGSSGAGMLAAMAATNLTGGSDDAEYYDVDIQSVKLYDQWENLIATAAVSPTKLETGKYEVPIKVPADYISVIQEWYAIFDGYDIYDRSAVNVLWAEPAVSPT